MSRDSRFGRLPESRDPELFRTIVGEYQDKVFRLVCSVLGPWSDVDAEDVTQDIFMRAWEKLSQFRGESAITTWLYRIAWTQAVNRRKSARIRLPHLSIDLLARPGGDDVHQKAVFSEKRERVAGCLEKLPDSYRATFYMHYWLGATVSEVAESLRLPSGTVKSYLARGRKQLKRCLEHNKEKTNE